MAKIIIYHNSRCSKSRCALQYLEDKKMDFDVVEYLKTSISFDELATVIEKLNLRPEELIRKNEADYKDNFKGKKLTDKEWVQAMIDFPKLIQRPIVISGNKAIIARPAEKLDDLFN